MEIRHLRSFLVLAEELHFTNAAARLRTHQPHLTRTIKSLEEELGVALFVRDKRHVTLTPPGRRLVAEARKAVRQFDRALAVGRGAGDGAGAGPVPGPGGQATIRLSLGTVAMTKKVRLLLTGFRQRHPSLALRLSEHKSSLPALEEVRRRAADLALISGPIPRGLSGRLVDTRRWVMVIPPGHRLFARERIARGDLDGEDVYTFQRSVRPTTFDLLRGFLRREHPGCTLHSPAREFDAAASAFYATGRASLLCMEDYCQSNRDWREVPFDAGDAPLTTIYLVGKEPLLLAAARALARHLAPG